MAQENIEKKAEEVIKKNITDLGYELYDVEYLKVGKDYHLCIYIDKKGGSIDISDCEKVNTVIEPILDSEDLIKEQYFLEVSSTGLEKNLRKKEHFEKQMNKKIELKLYSKINNSKILQGILLEYKADYLILKINNENIKVDNNQIASAKTVYDW